MDEEFFCVKSGFYNGAKEVGGPQRDHEIVQRDAFFSLVVLCYVNSSSFSDNLLRKSDRCFICVFWMNFYWCEVYLFQEIISVHMSAVYSYQLVWTLILPKIIV